MDQNLIFLDLETTGLKPVSQNRILEIGILPVDGNLEPLNAGWSALVHPQGYNLDHLNDKVREMHTENGLLEDLENRKGETLGLLETAHRAIRYCEQFGVRGQMPMAGSSLRFDREYLHRYMPGLDNWFHYRIVDVSSLKETWKRWFPELGEPPKTKGHRALEDCYASLEEYKWYRDRLTLTNEAQEQIANGVGLR